MSPNANTAKKPQNHSGYKPIEVGRILTVGSSAAIISINKSVIRNNLLHHTQIGTILKILTANSIVVAMVSALKIGAVDEDGLNDGCLATLNILGEISTNQVTKETKFFRGVRTFPVLNEAVYNMSPSDLELIFNRENTPCIDVGRLQQDNSIVAKVRTNDLLSKHFAIIGSTGSGKSCTVALVLQAILNESPQGHVVLFDPHNEYSKSFGNHAEVINSETLDLPLWMFDFVETVELLTSDIPDQATEEEEVLHEIVLKAKRLFDRAQRNNDISSQVKLDDIEAELQRATHISLDSPVPYRIRDVLKLIDHEMGKLENNSNLGPYRRLKRRINSIMAEPRYKFIFRNQASPRPIEEIVGRIFRLPVQGKPISILDFSSIPSEALNIVVSVVSRLAFELATWSERKIPILLVCEEAHRYIPRDVSQGFSSARRIISRIAKEGRKYGVSLAIISQRPSELEPSTLSQCSTIFSMRLSNEVDQNFVRAAVPDGASDLLSFLPSLGTAETMVFGEAVNLPMRVILNRLPEQYLPHSSSAVFTDLWSKDATSPEFMRTVFDRWRNRTVDLDANQTTTITPEQSSAHRSHKVARASTQQTPNHRHSAQSTQRQERSGMVGHNPATANKKGITPAMRQKILERSASVTKPQSLADVKSMLNNAFNRDI
jgi:DNA helicase HerA-like ATPase